MAQQLYIDMDNTILPFNMERWQQHKYPKIGKDRPWISTLPKDSVVVSRCRDQDEANLKRKWLQHYFPNIGRILTPISKERHVNPKDNFLISDWHEELFRWKQAGGIPIQLSNGTNHKHFKMFVHWYEDEEGVHLLDENNNPLI